MIETEVHIPIENYLPCYRHLLDSTADINFLWGGRDSGKSHFIAQKLIEKCLDAEYFRCILIKRTSNTIKESQWQTIKDIVDEWELSELFTFIENPLQIKCVNGNRFIARGCDDISNIKSIKDPSDVWYEEGNQISLTDFITIVTTLRTNKADIQQWFSFNPECDTDYQEFWLYNTFFEDKKSFNFEDKWRIELKDEEPVDIRFTSTHTTYIDNKHVSRIRKAFLEKLEFLDPYYYQVFTLGKWGNRKIDDPFCLRYDQAIHKGKVTALPRLDYYLSFDFNVNPITCGVYQHYAISDIKLKINCIESIKLDNSDIYKLCDYIKAKYQNVLFQVTGDATGQNTSALVQDGLNYYTVIKAQLNLSQGQLKVPTVNPPIQENRVLVNAVFFSYDVTFDTDNAKGLCFDCQYVSVNDLGKIDKGSRTNPKKRADHLDHFRYYCNTFHKHVLKS